MENEPVSRDDRAWDYIVEAVTEHSDPQGWCPVKTLMTGLKMVDDRPPVEAEIGRALSDGRLEGRKFGGGGIEVRIVSADAAPPATD